MAKVRADIVDMSRTCPVLSGLRNPDITPDKMGGYIPLGIYPTMSGYVRRVGCLCLA